MAETQEKKGDGKTSVQVDRNSLLMSQVTESGTHIGADQLRDLRQVFDSIDRNKNGILECEELIQAIHLFDPASTGDDECRGLVNELLKKMNLKHVTFDNWVAILEKYLPNYYKAPPVSSTTLPKINTLKIPQIKDWMECAEYQNPLSQNPVQFDFKNFITNDEKIMESLVITGKSEETSSKQFMRAGPRHSIVFNPKEVKACIVSCGGLCPGLNTVIRELVFCLYHNYGVTEIFGIQFGYRGFYSSEYIKLTPQTVSGIHNKGGTILGSSRGGFNLKKIVDAIESHGISQVYVMGGDGTHRGAAIIAEEIVKRKLHVAIACIPKTIDNDFQLIDRSFGFLTAVDQAQFAIKSAKVEAEGAPNGIGLVKLMGRQSGFIAAIASLASRDVDYCLIPEVPFHLLTLQRHIKRSLKEKGHVVVVVAEGAGTHILEPTGQVDQSGNPVLPDIGKFLKTSLGNYFTKENIEVAIKAIDPTYMIRSVPPNSYDSIYCTVLAQNAVHGAMAGFTGFSVGLINTHYVYLPIAALTTSPSTIDPKGRTWFRLMESTRQPDFSNTSNIFVALVEALEKELKKEKPPQKADEGDDARFG
eukprot:TRINITY_DN3651_c0_g1_i3.p1 TRINITY_DN3651_c0_g1~~TRINITY_DN3651_c0_g1_i3.p1  ORF type:complete len:588 (-),score=174.84 TRINITY_DN3651_c0_g1_i3:58-1821(-)